MRSRTVVVAMIAALVVTPGAAVARPVPAGPSPREAERLARSWTAPAAQGAIGSSPTYVHGSVYYTEDAWPAGDPRSGKRISRRDAVTGRSLPFAAPAIKALFLGEPASDGVRVFTISAYENAGPVARIRAYTLDGWSSWARWVPGEQFLPRVVVAGRLVIAAGELDCDREPEAGCARTTVAAWSAATGKPAWQRTVPGGAPQLTAAAGRLTVSTSTGPGVAALTAVDVATGHRVWSRKGLTAGPVAADAGHVYLAAGDLCALRAADGSTRWCVRDRRYHDVMVADGGLYTVSDSEVADRDERVDARTTGGRARWSVPASPTGPLTVSNGVVYFQHYPMDGPVLPHPVDRPTRLVALRGSTGARLAEVPLSDGYSSGAVAVGGGRVFTSAYLTAVQGFAPRR
ncbi:PQQ-binding-like beta-propeller repeat protein [Actinoplanes sp. NPDC049599]|uniref:outer membrane protein assembly factor BamB family protein n=1 Tax=Actinoplanes sp. NPDC049599 TaxID=3363903 RepID=UPI00379AFA80